jgi:hypothetical protein
MCIEPNCLSVDDRDRAEHEAFVALTFLEDDQVERVLARLRAQREPSAASPVVAAPAALARMEVAF